MSKANTVVVVLIDPAVMSDKFFAGCKGPVADTRWTPFDVPRSREGHGIPDNVSVHIERHFAPQYFFNRVRETWRSIPEGKYYDMSPVPVTEDHYVDYVNVWLGIVSHFGLDADYRPEFFELVKPVILDILTSGYREDPKETNPTNDRHFHDLVYTREGFQKEFSAFIMKHCLLT